MENNPNLARFQWNIKRLNLQKKIYFDSPSFIPKIALIDSGIDYNHTEFFGKINLNKSCNLNNENQDIMDNLGHGTMVAGIICAENVIQGCYPRVELFVYKITDSPSYYLRNLLRAINRAIDDQVNLINLSLSIPFDKVNNEAIEIISQLFEKANKNNIMIVIAAGNGSKKLISNFTNNYNNVILVGATNRKGLKSSYSNYGAIDYMAPGGDSRQNELNLDDSILTCYPEHLTMMDPLNNNLGIPKGYCISYGTSIAAAHLTGSIAFLLAHYFRITNTLLTPKQLCSTLSSGNFSNIQPHYSFHGEINLFN